MRKSVRIDMAFATVPKGFDVDPKDVETTPWERAMKNLTWPMFRPSSYLCGALVGSFSESFMQPFGTILVPLTPFPAAGACRDLVFVLGASGSNSILIKPGSQAQGANLGTQLGPPGQKVFSVRTEKSVLYEIK